VGSKVEKAVVAVEIRNVVTSLRVYVVPSNGTNFDDSEVACPFAASPKEGVGGNN
jgi:hypothetical protein